MNTKNPTKNPTSALRALVGALIAGGALVGAANASAEQMEPSYMLRAETNAPRYGDAHLMPVGVQLSIGWHDNRYWDGHRYWEHDEWMHHHPHDPGPPRYRDHDDHRPPQRY
ncbi:MAG TPA: hypothetical protein VL689_02605 [Paraburkholderia sp.]|jgi:hypothetical protein|nr:hypothetical protein [Paraburkholderia sp.]